MPGTGTNLIIKVSREEQWAAHTLVGSSTHFHCEEQLRWDLLCICHTTTQPLLLSYHKFVHAAVLFLSHPRSEGWPHHGRTFSIYLYPLSFWMTLPQGVLSTTWCCLSMKNSAQTFLKRTMHKKYISTEMVVASCMQSLWHHCPVVAGKVIWPVLDFLTEALSTPQHPACKTSSDDGLAWLSVCSEVQMICIWSSWCHCHPIISCFIKIQIASTFLAPDYPVCPEKEAIKRALLFVLSTYALNGYFHGTRQNNGQWYWHPLDDGVTEPT